MDRAVDWSVLVNGFRLSLVVQNLRPHTVECYVRDVTRFTSAIDRQPDKVTAADVRLYLAEFQAGRAAKTLRDAQLAIRRFFRFLVAEGELVQDPTRDVKLTRYHTDPQPQYTKDQVSRMLLVCGASLEGVRNQAVVRVLYDTGVRVAELISMKDVNWGQHTIPVVGKIKGGRSGNRQVPFGMATAQALERYVRRWRIDRPPLWRGKHGTLTDSGVRQLVKRLCRDSGTPYYGVHAFRRGSAAQMKRHGMNDSDIMEVMGWDDVEMLRRYTATVADELAQRAHKRYSPGDAL